MLVSYLPAFGATEVLLYDGTFTTTTNDHGFAYFKTPPAAGTTRWRTLAGNADALRRARANRAVLLPNSLQAAVTARRAGIPVRWGYRGNLRGWLLTRAVPRPRGLVHQADYYQRLVAALLVAMLRLAGLKAYPVLIHNGPKKDIEVPQPFFNQPRTEPAR